MARYFREGLVARDRIPLRPAGRHRIVSVDNREDTSAQGNFLTDQPAWVTGTVEVLVMRVDNLGSVLKEIDAFQDLVTQLRMAAHFLPFISVERGRLTKNAIRYADLADVMQRRGILDLRHNFTRELHCARDLGRRACYATSMTVGHFVTHIECSGEHHTNSSSRAVVPPIAPPLFEPLALQLVSVELGVRPMRDLLNITA